MLKVREIIFKSNRSKFISWLLIFLAVAFTTTLTFCDIQFTGRMSEEEALLQLKKQELEAKIYPKGKTKQNQFEDLAATIESEKSLENQYTNTFVGLFSYSVILLIWALPGTLYIYNKEINRLVPGIQKVKRLKQTNSFVIVGLLIVFACLAFGSIFGGLVFMK